MKTLKIIGCILLPFLGIAVVYLPTAFVELTFDFRLWPEKTRAFCAIMGTMCFCIGLVFCVFEIKEN